MPIAYTGEPSFGIFNFIAATLYVSLVAMVLAVTVGLGAAIYLSCVATQRMRESYPFADAFSRNPIRDSAIWLHGADPYGQAFSSGPESTQAPACWRPESCWPLCCFHF